MLSVCVLEWVSCLTLCPDPSSSLFDPSSSPSSAGPLRILSGSWDSTLRFWEWDSRSSSTSSSSSLSSSSAAAGSGLSSSSFESPSLSPRQETQMIGHAGSSQCVCLCLFVQEVCFCSSICFVTDFLDSFPFSALSACLR